MLVYLQMIEAQSDREKFEEIHTDYRKLMLYVANEVLKNDQDAEDAVHEAFISVAKNLQKISQGRCRKTCAFVVTIVRRKAIDILRKRRRLQTSEFDEETYVPAPSMKNEGSLSSAIDTLPEKQRDVLYLHYFTGYSVREIAELLEMNPSAVYKLMERAKAALRKILEEEGLPL